MSFKKYPTLVLVTYGRPLVMSGLQNWWIITWTASGYNPLLVTCSANLPAVKQDEKASVFAVFVPSRPFTGPLWIVGQVLDVPATIVGIADWCGPKH